jgi:hypothetical protein
MARMRLTGRSFSFAALDECVRDGWPWFRLGPSVMSGELGPGQWVAGSADGYGLALVARPACGDKVPRCVRRADAPWTKRHRAESDVQQQSTATSATSPDSNRPWHAV